MTDAPLDDARAVYRLIILDVDGLSLDAYSERRRLEPIWKEWAESDDDPEVLPGRRLTVRGYDEGMRNVVRISVLRSKVKGVLLEQV